MIRKKTEKSNKRTCDTAAAEKVITYNHVARSNYAGCRQERRTKRTIYRTRRGNWFEAWESHGGIEAKKLSKAEVKDRLLKLLVLDVYRRFFGEL